MILAFELHMPGVNSWNGRWSGESDSYVKCITVGRTKRAILNAAMILHKPSYGYDFGDGWYARVDVRAVDAAEARKLRRKSSGFCGYDWMIDEIQSEGRILPLAERPTAG